MASKKLVNEMWEKASAIRGKNPGAWRRDDEDNLIRRGSYGTTGEYGWEIDHRNPVAKGGTDNPRNMRPLHWQENREKGDKR